MQGEMLEFPGNTYGMALNLERDSVGAVVLGDYENISEGDTVKAHRPHLDVPVGPGPARPRGQRPRPADRRQGSDQRRSCTDEDRKGRSGVIARKSVYAAGADRSQVRSTRMVPIGRGQRELIIGDRQTGKTAVAVDTIINQKGKNLFCVYVAIGQKASTIANVVRKLEENGAMEYTIVVAASASETAALQYLAPYAGCHDGRILPRPRSGRPDRL